MERRTELVRREGRERFAFLVAEGAFTGPREIEDGVAYERSGVRVTLRYLGPREPEVVTSVHVVTAAGEVTHAASLDCLYVAFGAGPLQDVPGSAANRKTVTKRVRQQATALRKILPAVLGPELDDAVRRCQGRLQPDT